MLRGPTFSSCGGLWPLAEAFFAPWAKTPIMLFWPIFGNFWCLVVTLVTFSSYLSNFERNPKIRQNLKKNPKILKNPKIKKSKKSPRILKIIKN